MNLYPGDIYIKNDRGNITAWISENAIYNCCDMSDQSYFRRKARNRYNGSVQDSFLNDLKSGTRQLLPDTGSSWRYGRINGQYYYCFDNIPTRYREQLGTREQILSLATSQKEKSANNLRDLFIDHLKASHIDYVDQSDIPFYMYECGYNISLSDANDIAEARGWMEMISHYEDSQKYKDHGIRFEQDFFELSVGALPSAPGNNLHTPDSLRKKIHYYRQSEDKRLFMLSGKLGNDNRRIVGIYPVVSPETGEIFNFDIHETLIYELWMNPGHPNKRLKVDVYKEYEEQILHYGLSPVKPRTVNFYLNRFSSRSKMSLERDGRDHFNDTYKPYIVQSKLRYALTMWAADYSGSKLYYRTRKQKWTDKRQRTSVWKAESWYLFRVFDVATGCVLGWSVCESGEDFQQVAEGLRQAVVKSGGHAACELVTDHGPAFTRKENAEKLALLFKKHRKITVGNKQANPAEMYIHLMSQKSRQFDNWMRTSFNANHIDNIANPDYIDINDLPTKEAALEQIAQVIEQWNIQQLKDGRVRESFSTDPDNFNPKAPRVDSRIQRFVFGNETTVRLARTRGVMILSKGTGPFQEDYKFQVPHWETAVDLIDTALGGDPNMHVIVRWDQEGADLYTPGGRFIMTAVPAVPSHKSEFESTEESFQALEDQTAAKARFERESRKFEEQISEARAAIEGEISPDELTYIQRAQLNGGKAKDEHNTLMQAIYEVNKETKALDEDNTEFSGDVIDDF